MAILGQMNGEAPPTPLSPPLPPWNEGAAETTATTGRQRQR